MSRPDNVMYASDDDEDFPIDEKKRKPVKKPEEKKPELSLGICKNCFSQ